jgi:8-oxo-dGTP diphosphatase
MIATISARGKLRKFVSRVISDERFPDNSTEVSVRQPISDQIMSTQAIVTASERSLLALIARVRVGYNPWTQPFPDPIIMPYTPILATLGYILSPDRKRVLMIHRNARGDDHHFSKYNGLGGKLAANEDVSAGMRREIREEAGIECLDMSLRGTISWPGFGKRGEDWFGFLFIVTRFAGVPLERNPEGALVWVDLDRLHDLSLWEGDRLFLELVFDADPRQFHGVMPYHAGRMVSWTYGRL